MTRVDDDTLAQLISLEEPKLQHRSAASLTLHRRAEKVFTTGTPTALAWHAPLPLTIVRGAGSRVWDADGVEYVDLHNAFSVGVAGHCHPAVVDAIHQQSSKLLLSGFTSGAAIELGEELCRRYDAEQAQLTNSGT